MHSQATVDRARALSEQGVFDREVALIVGVPLRTVRNWRPAQWLASPWAWSTRKSPALAAPINRVNAA